MSSYTQAVSNSELDLAVAHLRDSGVIALPTDTQYALSAVATDDLAVARIFRLKRRPSGENLPILLPPARWRDHLAEIAAPLEDRVLALAEVAWPGAVTVIVSRRPGWRSRAIVADTVALRIPDHPVAAAVLDAIDQPLTGTSANLHGEAAARCAADVRRQFASDLHARNKRETLRIVHEQGDTPAGLASTILDCTGPAPRVVRRGPTLDAAIGELLLQHWGLSHLETIA